MLNLKEEIEGIKEWIREYVKETGAKGVVIGNSGGKDSATVLALASASLGTGKIVAVSMPCHSNEKDYNDAKIVADALGIKNIKIDLTSAYDIFEQTINDELTESKLVTEATINIKPRLRMTTLYAIAQSMGYLVMGTGNMCEIAVGYTTKWGDSASDFNPIGNFTVSEVLEIGRILGVPEVILNKAPSDGLGDLTDEEKMGIRYSQIEEMIEKGYIEDKKAQEEIVRRFKNSEHKRRGVPIYMPKTIERDFSKLENY